MLKLLYVTIYIIERNKLNENEKFVDWALWVIEKN